MKKSFFSKAVSIFLAILMLISMMGVGVGAQAKDFEDYTYEISEDGKGVIITGYMGEDVVIIIPSQIENLPVTAIGDRAFSYLGYSEGPNEIVIPDSVTSIGDDAFAGCYDLTEINLPESLVSIGEYAFSSTKITEINIPESLISIGENAFIGCYNLEDINIARGNTIYSSVDGVLFSKDGTELLFYPMGRKGAYTVPDGVTKIGVAAFSSRDSLTEVVLPDGLTTIGDNAFYGCENLSKINIPDGVTHIGDSTFNACFALTEMVIPDSVELIGNLAFSDCTNLIDITLPDGLTLISDNMFFRCMSLTEFTIPSNVTSVGYYAFEGCTNLENIYVAEGNTVYEAVDGVLIQKETNVLIKCPEGKTGTYAIPEGVITVAQSAFYDCRELNEIIIPSSVTLIYGAVWNCTSLKNINVSEDNTVYSSVDGVLLTKDLSELIMCPKDKWGAYNIPYGVETIKKSAFYECGELTEIKFPNTLKTIEDNAFLGCMELTEIKIPKSVTKIGYEAFGNCVKIENIHVSKNNAVYSSDDGVLLTKDKSKVLMCPDAKQGEYIIPNEVTTITENAFSGCYNLTGADIPNGVTTIENNAFQNCAISGKMVIPESVTTMGDAIFFGCNKLTEVVLPTKLKSIGWRTFARCSKLNKVVIPDSVSSIDGFAFEECYNLTEIVIPENVTTIDYHAFYMCSSLSEITILNPNTAIGGETEIPAEATIYGYENSTAQAYAEENGNEFIALEGEPSPNLPIPLPYYAVRLYGNTRINTANRIAVEGWGLETAETVVLANAMNFADALAGGPLAAAYDAPMLLTNADHLDETVLETIENLEAKNVIILGGVGAISEAVEADLTSKEYTVTRIAGKSRYETAVKIAQALAEKLEVKTFDKVFIADGGNFPDALAASPVAAIEGVPILFTYGASSPLGDEIDENTFDYLTEIEPDKTYILGGEGAISKAVMDLLENPKRIYGSSRYETSAAIYKEFKSVFEAGTLTFATGANFPDALAGSAYAAKLKAPVILVDNKNTVDSVRKAVLNAEAELIYVFGGDDVVSNRTVENYSK